MQGITIERGTGMRKTFLTIKNINKHLCELMTIIYKLKGEEKVRNEEIAEEIQEAINDVDTAMAKVRSAGHTLNQIYTECYDD